ncbi:MAG: hypothetical protein JW829_08385, partial [Pirellulales bacterium]|nr:hypothetical protein [Pirellulales bacterium]
MREKEARLFEKAGLLGSVRFVIVFEWNVTRDDSMDKTDGRRYLAWRRENIKWWEIDTRGIPTMRQSLKYSGMIHILLLTALAS